MGETANSVARPCRKRRVKRKVRLNKLSQAHLAGFIVSSPVEPCHYTDVADFGLYGEKKRGMGACSLPAFPLPEFHWACQRRGGGRKGDSRRGRTVFVTYISVPLLLSPPSKFLPVGRCFVFPTVLPVSPSCEVFVFERHFWPRIVSFSAFQGWICALIVQTITTVLEMYLFSLTS